MKKLFIYTLVLLSVLTLSSRALAGGDKVQGDRGQGEISQEGPCPFGGDTPAGPNM